MKRFIGQRGFTLVELAIVLVIIGIILGAVLKGQDLIQGARTKKFVNDAGRKFELAAWSYYDKRGRFAGDDNRDGIIAFTGDVATPFADYSVAKLSNTPSTPVQLGSYSFWVFYGHDASNKNCIAICKDATCASAFTADELEFAEAFDTAMDGSVDGRAGMVRNATGITTPNATNWSFNGATASTLAWGAADHAILYYFDRRP